MQNHLRKMVNRLIDPGISGVLRVVRLQLRTVLVRHQRIDWHFFAVMVKPKFEPVGEKVLKHQVQFFAAGG